MQCSWARPSQRRRSGASATFCILASGIYVAPHGYDRGTTSQADGRPWIEGVGMHRMATAPQS